MSSSDLGAATSTQCLGTSVSLLVTTVYVLILCSIFCDDCYLSAMKALQRWAEYGGHPALCFSESALVLLFFLSACLFGKDIYDWEFKNFTKTLSRL